MYRPFGNSRPLSRLLDLFEEPHKDGGVALAGARRGAQAAGEPWARTYYRLTYYPRCRIKRSYFSPLHHLALERWRHNLSFRYRVYFCITNFLFNLSAVLDNVTPSMERRSCSLKRVRP